MEARSVKPALLALFTVCLCAAPSAGAVIYKWIDAAGRVTYSNWPPPDTSRVRHLTRVAGIDVPADASPTGNPTAVREKRIGDSAVTNSDASAPRPEQSGSTARSSIARPEATLSTQEPSFSRPETWMKRSRPAPAPTEVTTKSDMPTAPIEAGAATRDAEGIPRAPVRGLHTEAVRDPCLRSSDPKCHERNKDRYHPYFGHAPSLTQSVAPPAVGTTSGATTGVAVGGQVGAPPANSPVRRIETPLVPAQPVSKANAK